MITIFNIGKKDIGLSYLAYFLRFFSSIIILPFLLSSLTKSEYAIWNIFLAINTFVVLFDMGYGVVISRYAMYAYSGVKESELETLKDIKGSDEPNYYYLYQIMIAAKKIYSRISTIVIFVLIIMTMYILHIANNNLSTSQVVIAWLIFSLSVYFNMFILSEATIIKGLGMIKELQVITITNTLFGIISKIVLLKLGYNLIGLSIAYLITAMLLIIQYFKITNKIRKIKFAEYNKALKTFDDQFKRTFKIITSKSKGIGGVLISNFIQNQLFLLIAPLYLSLEVVGSYGLSWQLVSVIGAFSSVPFNTYLMKMGNLIVKDDKNKLKEVFSISTFIFVSFFVLGAFILTLFGADVLKLFNSNTKILPFIPLTVMILQGYILQSIQKNTNIISLTNEQSYVKALVISSIVTISLQMIIFNTNPNLLYLLLCNVMVQASYNLWKWGKVSMDICGVTYKIIMQVPITKLITNIRK